MTTHSFPPRGATTARDAQGFACLHGLRGVLALWVVLYHTSPGAFGPLHVARHGYLAVDMFFLMSGFILMHTHQQDFRRLTLRAALHFWSLRVWRTYPLNIAACLVSVAVTLAIAGWLPPAATLIDSALFMNSWDIPVIDRVANGPIWSLKVEWYGYLAFPMLCWALNRLSPRAAVMLIAPAILAIEVGVLASGWLGPDFTAMNLPHQLLRLAGGFGLGCVLRVGFEHPLVRHMRGDGLMLAMLAGAILVLLLSEPPGTLPLLAVIVMIACRPGRLTQWLLTNRVASYLGRISFSIYMVHVPIVTLFYDLQLQAGGALPSGAFTLGALITAFALASLLCRLLEEPARRVGRRLTNVHLPLLYGHQQG